MSKVRVMKVRPEVQLYEDWGARLSDGTCCLLLPFTKTRGGRGCGRLTLLAAKRFEGSRVAVEETFLSI